MVLHKLVSSVSIAKKKKIANVYTTRKNDHIQPSIQIPHIYTELEERNIQSLNV